MLCKWLNKAKMKANKNNSICDSNLIIDSEVLAGDCDVIGEYSETLNERKKVLFSPSAAARRHGRPPTNRKVFKTEKAVMKKEA